MYVVATPIGNLADITYRAVEVLRSVDLILAEDTRHSRALLQHYGIQARLVSLHEHNERDKAKWVINQLDDGKTCALISDAGTPLISDPGYVLVNSVRAAGHSVIPTPGPCALVAALSTCGLPTDKFIFLGFVPIKSSAQNMLWQRLLECQETAILYESTHRLMSTLNSMHAELGAQRQMCVAKELTKAHEAIVTGTVSAVLDWFNDDLQRTKGEFVLLIAPVERQVIEDEVFETDITTLINCFQNEVKPKVLAKILAKLSNAQAKQIYDKIVDYRNKELNK